jgi:hypothetical protein
MKSSDTLLQTMLGTIDPKIAAKIKMKFPEDADFDFCLKELCRYLVLSYQAEEIFFPYDKTIDDLWHNIICETRTYAMLCKAIAPDCFIHHSGLTYEDFKKDKSINSLYESLIAYVVNYSNHFGAISEQAFRHMLLAQYLTQLLNCNVDGLNKTIASLQETEGQDSLHEPSDFESFFCKIVKPKAEVLDQNYPLMHFIFDQFFSTLQGNAITDTLLERGFEASGALGFLLWQCKAANDHYKPSVFEKTGLATTHLASRNPETVLGRFINDEEICVNGHVPWMSGYGFYNKIILGFRINHQIFRALVDISHLNEHIQIKPLEHLNIASSTNTISFDIHDLILNKKQLIQNQITNAPTPFYMPDIGLALASIDFCSDFDEAKDILGYLRKEYDTLKSFFGRCDLDSGLKLELGLRKDELILKSARTACILDRGRSTNATSKSNRFWREVWLVDSTYQPQDYRQAKLARLTDV